MCRTPNPFPLPIHAHIVRPKGPPLHRGMRVERGEAPSRGYWGQRPQPGIQEGSALWQGMQGAEPPADLPYFASFSSRGTA